MQTHSENGQMLSAFFQDNIGNTSSQTILNFGDDPIPGTYIVPNTIGPEDGRHLFTYIGHFLIYVTPNDISIGKIHSVFSMERKRFFDFIFLGLVKCILEMLRDLFHFRVSLFDLILEVRCFDKRFPLGRYRLTKLLLFLMSFSGAQTGISIHIRYHCVSTDVNNTVVHNFYLGMYERVK